jgi:hypothetical protein
MKIVKRILIIIGIIIAVPLIAALFVKKEYAVVRDITINKPKQEVFNYIKYLKNQDYYSKWNQMDPNMKKEYKGEDGTVGFIYSWDSQLDSVGKGDQEIKKITEGERVDFEIRFHKPFESTDNAYMTTTAVDSTSTKVQWGFEGKMPYPMNLMCVFVSMDEMLGKDLEKGLSNLKGVLEKE